jgi:beta-lactamase class A
MDFQTELESVLKRFSGLIGFQAVRLSDGFTLESNPDVIFPAASVIKVHLLLEALKQVEEGRLELHKRIPLPADERVGGSGVLQCLEPEAGLTLRDYLTLMIIVSDNTATNIVLETIGGREVVNRRLETWGMSVTRVVGKLMLPFELKNEDQKAGKLAEITPREIVTLLQKLHAGELLNPDLTKLALEIMGQQQYTEILARYLPDGTTTATKSGQIQGVRNDVGFVDSSQPYVLALCSKDCRDLRYHIDNEAVLALGEVSKLVFDAMNGRH